MYLYYNKNGELLTIIPHGQPPRQNNFLNLYICLDYDYFDQSLYSGIDLGESLTNFKMLVDVTKPNNTSCLNNLPNSYDYKQFQKTNDSEITFALVDQRSYLTFEFKLAPELSTNIAGNIKIGITTYCVDSNNTIIEETRKTFAAATIFVEKTFTNDQYNNDSTYFQIQRQINLLNTNVILLRNRVNDLAVTGIEISLASIGYTEPSGSFVPSDFPSYCHSFGKGKILVCSLSQEDMENYPKLWNFLKSCSLYATNDINDIVISNAGELIFQVKLVNTVGDVISSYYFNNKWNNDNSTQIPVSINSPSAPEIGDIWFKIIQ